MKLPGDQSVQRQGKVATQTHEVEENGKLYRRNRRQFLKTVEAVDFASELPAQTTLPTPRGLGDKKKRATYLT